MQKKKNPKKPSDNRTLRIRVPPEKEVEMKSLMQKVEKVRELKNKKKSPEDKIWMGNHVLLEAIERGLEAMSKGK